MDHHIKSDIKIFVAKILLIIVVGTAVTNCKDRFLGPEEARSALVGSWQRRYETSLNSLVGVSTFYTNIITFHRNGSYSFSSLNDAFDRPGYGPNITYGEYSVSGNQITMVDTSHSRETFNLIFKIADSPRILNLQGLIQGSGDYTRL